MTVRRKHQLCHQTKVQMVRLQHWYSWQRCMKHPKISKTTDRDGKLKWRRALIVEFDKIVAEARVNNDNEERKDKNN